MDLFLNDSLSLNDNVLVVYSYTTFCVNSIIPTKTLTVFPNNKPWVTKELKNILNKKKGYSCQELMRRKTILIRKSKEQLDMPD